MTARPAASAVAAALAAAAAAAVYGGAGAPLRPLVTLAFLLVGPGLALAGFLRLDGVLAPAVLVVAGSIVVDGAVAELLVLTRAWSPGLALAILVALSAVGAAVQLVVRLGRLRGAA